MSRIAASCPHASVRAGKLHFWHAAAGHHRAHAAHHFGHAAGDEVLRRIAGVLRANLRHNDLAARIGGEEFVILLPETQLADAAQHAERLRKAIAGLRIPVEQSMLSVTVSIGVAALDTGELSPEPMLMRADSGLYRAKQDGRNRVQVTWNAAVGDSRVSR